MGKISTFSHYIELTSEETFFVRIGNDDWDNHIMVSKSHKSALCGYAINKEKKALMLDRLSTRTLYADMLCSECVDRIYRKLAKVKKV